MIPPNGRQYYAKHAPPSSENDFCCNHFKEVKYAKEMDRDRDRTDARIFSEKPFKRIGQLKNLLGRAKNREMTTDLHGTEGEKNPHEDAAIMFAKRLSEYLRKAHAMNLFDSLTVVAEPKMLGRVKSEFHKTIKGCTDWVGKDFGHASNIEIPRLLGLKVSARV